MSKVYVCLACGKMSNDKAGYDTISWGWDISCMMNSEEFNKEDLVIDERTGRVTKINNGDSDETTKQEG